MKLNHIMFLGLLSSLFFAACGGTETCQSSSDCDKGEVCGYPSRSSDEQICFRPGGGGGGGHSNADSGTSPEEDSTVAEPPKPILNGWSVSSVFPGVSDPAATIGTDGTGTLTITPSVGGLPITLNLTVEYAPDGAPKTLTSVEEVNDRQYVIDILYEDGEFDGFKISHGLPIFNLSGASGDERVMYTNNDDEGQNSEIIFMRHMTKSNDGSQIRAEDDDGSYIEFYFTVPPPVDAAIPPPPPVDAGVDSAQPPPPPCIPVRVVDFNTSPVFPGANPVIGTVDFENQTGSFNFDGNQDSGGLVIDPVFHRPTSISGTNFLVFFDHRPAGQLENIRVFYNVQGGSHAVGEAWKVTNLLGPSAQLISSWYPDSNSEGTVTRDGNTITVEFPAGTFTVHVACTTP